MLTKIPAIACSLVLASLARAEAPFCDKAATQVMDTAFAAWYGAEITPSSQPYDTRSATTFLDCVNICQAERKRENEGQPNMDANGQSPPQTRGCRSVNWEEESKYCKTFATIPQNVLSSMYPQEGKAKNGAIIDPCESERIEAVKFHDSPGTTCCNVWYRW